MRMRKGCHVSSRVTFCMLFCWCLTLFCSGRAWGQDAVVDPHPWPEHGQQTKIDSSHTKKPFTFVAIGDIPYQYFGHSQDHLRQFRRLIQAIHQPSISPDFVVHVGDIKTSQTPCTQKRYDRVKALFATFQMPLVYTPGDNEWTDCDKAQAGGYDPVERLGVLRDIFFSETQPLDEALGMTRQSKNPGYEKFVENVRWYHHGVVLTTLHVVGSNNNHRVPSGEQPVSNATEFQERHQANMVWLRAAFQQAKTDNAIGLVIFMHADPGFQRWPKPNSGFEELVATLKEEVTDFRQPVLLVHGDSHKFKVDHPFGTESGSKTEKGSSGGLTRLIVFGGWDVHGVTIRVNPTDPELFHIQPLWVEENKLNLSPFQ